MKKVQPAERINNEISGLYERGCGENEDLLNRYGWKESDEGFISKRRVA